MGRTRHASRWVVGGSKRVHARIIASALSALAAALALAVAPAAANAEGSSAVSWGKNTSWQLGSGYRSNPGEFHPVTP
jgi:hypothetical protein